MKTKLTEKFKQKILPKKEPYLRDGQAFMNFLYEENKGFYREVIANDFDCFYSDLVLPDTLSFIDGIEEERS